MCRRSPYKVMRSVGLTAMHLS